MPASFVLYSKPDDAQNLQRTTLTQDSTLTYYTRDVYNDPACNPSNLIGSCFYETYSHVFNNNLDPKSYGTNLVLYGNIFIKFNSNSRLPSGDNNILVLSGSNCNKFVNGTLIDGLYKGQVNSFLSTGEWAGQVGYSEQVRDRAHKLNDKTTVNFPLPIVTYTNDFNSLPQTSTAPLPA